MSKLVNRTPKMVGFIVMITCYNYSFMVINQLT